MAVSYGNFCIVARGKVSDAERLCQKIPEKRKLQKPVAIDTWVRSSAGFIGLAEKWGLGTSDLRQLNRKKVVI